MTANTEQRKQAAIMFTDMVGCRERKGWAPPGVVDLLFEKDEARK